MAADKDVKKNQVIDSPRVARVLRVAFYAALAILLALGFFVPGHPHFLWERLPGFFALYGFISCVVIIAVSKILGKLLLTRKEDYYDW